MRTDKEILLATRPFAHDVSWRSWWHLISTIVVAASLIGIAAYDALGVLRVIFGVLAGLTLVRLFVLFHDHQHGSILAQSRIANGIMASFGLWALNPPSVWKRSHDHHHHNNSKLYGPNVGSYPLMTVEAYERATRWERWRYAATRHPLTIAGGYLSVFLLGMCIAPFLANPRRHADALVSVAFHICYLAWLATGGADDFWLAGILPFTVGSGLGAYLFFAQHNFPGARIHVGTQWSYVAAALHSSSFVAMSPLMRWFTGNIGYHHVHHLNSKIPFYRLSEAMRAIPETHHPTTVTLGLRDVRNCLRLKLWDADAGRLVPWPRAPRSPARVAA